MQVKCAVFRVKMLEKMGVGNNFLHRQKAMTAIVAPIKDEANNRDG